MITLLLLFGETHYKTICNLTVELVNRYPISSYEDKISEKIGVTDRATFVCRLNNYMQNIYSVIKTSVTKPSISFNSLPLKNGT